MMRLQVSWIILIFLCFSSNVFCAPKPRPTAPLVPITDVLKISGYIDTSYNFLYHKNKFISGYNDRELDLNENGVTLQQFALIIEKQPPEGLGGLVDVILGRDAINLYLWGFNPYIGIKNIGLTATQAFLQYKWTALTIAVGMFDTLIGSEDYNPTHDTNFSRSFLDAYAEPGSALGIRALYVVNPAITLIMSVNNGWDTIEDTSRRKTLGLGFTYFATKQVRFSLIGFNGQQNAEDGRTTGPRGIRSFVNFITTVDYDSHWNFMFTYDYGIQNRALLPWDERLSEAIWQGAIGYINYKFNDTWRTSTRLEIFSDKDGYRTGVAQFLKEATFTVGYKPLKDLELRAETRRDISNVNSYRKKNGEGFSNFQQSFALEVLYQFG